MPRERIIQDHLIDDRAFLAAMRENVVRSRGHVAAQARIIEDLALHGPSVYLDTARDLMITMRSHLSVEETILARLECKAAGLS